MQKIILASTSPFRATLLKKLHLPFEQASPDIDESTLADETPFQLVKRLTEAKARAVSSTYSEHLIIASDQVALFCGEILGKPGNFEKAFLQLTQFSGQSVTFLTGLALLNSATDTLQIAVESFEVEFRQLSSQQIEHYLQLEQPYNCAGSFKSEGLGITLFKRLNGDDPNTLVGLPLIKLTNFLAKEGLLLPIAKTTQASA